MTAGRPDTTTDLYRYWCRRRRCQECKWGPWRGTDDVGWCDMWNMEQHHPAFGVVFVSHNDTVAGEPICGSSGSPEVT